MEVQESDSKKLFKVFDASKRKRQRKKAYDSAATDESNSGICTASRGIPPSKTSLLHPAATSQGDGTAGKRSPERKRAGSSPSVSNSPDTITNPKSPDRYRQRHGLSLALKAGLPSSPRTSVSPRQESDGMGRLPREQDSFLYAFLEDAIKKDKKSRQRRRSHHQRHESRETCEPSEHQERERDREHRHQHRRRHRESRDRNRQNSGSPVPTNTVDQNIILETLAKLCTQLKEKAPPEQCRQTSVSRLQSTKSLQCNVSTTNQEACVSQRTVHNPEPPANYSVSKMRSCVIRGSPPASGERREYSYHYDCRDPRIPSNYRMSAADDQYRDYPAPTRSCMNHAPYPNNRPYDPRMMRSYENDKCKYLEQQTSRSFDLQRMSFQEDEKLRRTARSDFSRKRLDEQECREKYDDPRDRRYEEPREKRYDDGRDKYDEVRESRHRYIGRRDSLMPTHRSRRNLEHCEQASVVSRDDVRDRLSGRERDSELSAADGENSTIISGKSNYLKVVKQEIAEQRESMDKMMKLWKELMRCFKGISKNGLPGQEKAVQESAAGVQESAVAQLKLWQECMRRYETVARDVGDTDARLMEEINKQRSEMTEMASMWQECLQRYRDISTDFNNLKQKLNESPSRPPHPPTCADAEIGIPAAAQYHVPQYPPQVPQIPHQMPPPPLIGGGYGGSPLRHRSSAPPPWWWSGEPHQPARRRSSPESRGSPDHHDRRDHDRDRDRDRRRRKETDESRYKDKAKVSGGRSEHRHRKR